jgi:amino-acid N-acetyltransferase
MTIIRRANSADLPAITVLLSDAKLPLAGVATHVSDFLIAEDGGPPIGCVGLERYGAAGLLRSLVVHATSRGAGVGESLTLACIEAARASGICRLVLLTETADRYFPRFGFQAITRDALPEALHESEELRGACPASARALMLVLCEG